MMSIETKMLFWCQDLASTIDEEDVAKFTAVAKEFDSITPLVYLFRNKLFLVS